MKMWFPSPLLKWDYEIKGKFIWDGSLLLSKQNWHRGHDGFQLVKYWTVSVSGLPGHFVGWNRLGMGVVAQSYR